MDLDFCNNLFSNMKDTRYFKMNVKISDFLEHFEFSHFHISVKNAQNA